MISSMTAFAREGVETVAGSLVWEIRAVNHRFLEFLIKLPEPLRNLEPDIRNLLASQLMRGKIEATLRFQPKQSSTAAITLNKSLVHQLSKASQTIQSSFPHSQVNVIDILNWPGVVEMQETDVTLIHSDVLSLLKKTMNQLIEARRREGKALKVFIEERSIEIGTHLQHIKIALSQVLENQKMRLLTRFSELQVEVDKQRLEQEFVWLTQKTDVAEELKRLDVHLAEVQRVLDEGGVVGRKLDFLIQELNREANTLGNKSWDMVISQASVEMKVLIEQMREQVQNIE